VRRRPTVTLQLGRLGRFGTHFLFGRGYGFKAVVTGLGAPQNSRFIIKMGDRQLSFMPAPTHHTIKELVNTVLALMALG
jgi:hypothetical protein